MNEKILRDLERQLNRCGHVWVPLSNLCPIKTSEEAIHLATEHNLAYCEMDKIIYVTTKLLAKQESKIAKHVFRILQGSVSYPDVLVDALIKKGEKQFGIHLHIYQKEAVKTALNHALCIITGGPGTGKTAVLKMIDFCLRFLQKNTEICYMAPTGKAAKKITESTGHRAYTINSRLGIGCIENNMTEIKSKKKLPLLSFVDECSMIDTLLGGALFEAVPTGGKLILNGDIDQLMSVGPGAVLRDLIDCGLIPVAYLTFTYRQDTGSSLYENICNIREGIPTLNSGNDFVYQDIQYMDETVVQKSIIENYLSYVKKYGLENVACLTPYRKSGNTCSNVLNNLLQEVLNPPSKNTAQIYVKTADGAYYLRVGDPVLQTVNHEDIVNGDVGKIIAIDHFGVTVQFSDVDQIQIYDDKKKIKELSLAYAMTIGKAQGSEYDAVVTCLLPTHKYALNRSTLYTAVTRGKQECSLLSSEKVLTTALATETGRTRITMLVEKIQMVSHGLERIAS